VEAGEATVVCRKGNEGGCCWVASAARSELGEDLEELKLVAFVEKSGNFGVGRVAKRERR
jgi:hypothetical protein